MSVEELQLVFGKRQHPNKKDISKDQLLELLVINLPALFSISTY